VTGSQLANRASMRSAEACRRGASTQGITGVEYSAHLIDGDGTPFRHWFPPYGTGESPGLVPRPGLLHIQEHPILSRVESRPVARNLDSNSGSLDQP
jgi:hypothetical protein